MIADISITEKSFGDKSLMSDVRFSVSDGEKVGVVGRNGIGKSTLFAMLAGLDTDFTGDIVYRRGLSVVATAQEHHVASDVTVLQYILEGLPEYARLSHVIETYPETMGDDMAKITEYTEALERFEQKGFYQIEAEIERELENFQLVEYGRATEAVRGAVGARQAGEPDDSWSPAELGKSLKQSSASQDSSSSPAGLAEAPRAARSLAHRPFASLSGGQKRLVEVVKVMHSQAGLALLDEPTNHMDYVAKQQFIDWMTSERTSKIAMLIVTHDRDVLKYVDRIVELRDGHAQSYKGNYDAYLRQNAERTSTGMNDFAQVERRIVNLKAKVTDYQRLKEKARNPATIQKFKRLERISREELAQLQAIEKPTFWIDKDSVDQLHYKAAGQYEKFKARTIRMNVNDAASRSSHVLVSAKGVSLGYGTPLFEGVNIDLREGEALELRGRNGAGKSTLIKALLGANEVTPRSSYSSGTHQNNDSHVVRPSASPRHARPLSADESWSSSAGKAESSLGTQAHNGSSNPQLFTGTLMLDPQARVGVYEQEVSPTYFDLTLHDAIEKIYLERNLSIGETKIRQLMSDYLFTSGDADVPVARLSGGQKARLQIIAMLANDPQLLVLDEPTNHLDLPSIEELETALARYAGALLYVSHDTYFRTALGGDVVVVG